MPAISARFKDRHVAQGRYREFAALGKAGLTYIKEARGASGKMKTKQLWGVAR